MSIRMGLAVATGLFAAFALAGNAGAEMAAPSKAAKPKPQKFTGCASKGTPDFCTMLKVQGKTYNVSSANPPLPIGKLVSGWGNVTTDVSPCGGTVLNVVKFNLVKGKCPKSK
jgi:hypothetical protein